MPHKNPASRSHTSYYYLEDQGDHQVMSQQGKRNALLLAAAGVAATAAGIYLLTGERGARNREHIKHWVNTAREEIMDRVGKLKNFDAETVKGIVDSVLRHYPGIKDRDAVEIAQLGKDLKSYWNDATTDSGETQTRSRRPAYHHPDNE